MKPVRSALDKTFTWPASDSGRPVDGAQTRSCRPRAEFRAGRPLPSDPEAHPGSVSQPAALETGPFPAGPRCCGAFRDEGLRGRRWAGGDEGVLKGSGSAEGWVGKGVADVWSLDCSTAGQHPVFRLCLPRSLMFILVFVRCIGAPPTCSTGQCMYLYRDALVMELISGLHNKFPAGQLLTQHGLPHVHDLALSCAAWGSQGGSL